jgi:hypothetical protein
MFGVGGRDDDYITYWEAEKLAKTGHLVNINGAPIEQSSSLLHVVVLAVLHLLTSVPIPVLSYFVGIACLALTIWLSSRLALLIKPDSEVVTAFVVALAFPLVYWATGGLETLLAAVAMLWFILVLVSALSGGRLAGRKIAAFGVSTVLVVTVRPDTMLVATIVVASGLAAALIRKGLQERVDRWIPFIDPRRAGALTLVVVGAVGLLAIFREVIFHSLLPQPDKAKVSGLSPHRLGLAYLYHSFPLWMWAVLVVLGGVGLVRCVQKQSLPGLVASLACIWGMVSIVFTYGDWMGAARLLVPYLAPGLVVVAVGVCSLVRPWRQIALVVLLSVECLTLLGLFAFENAIAPDQATATGQPVGGAWQLEWGPGPHPSGSVPMPWYVAWNATHQRDAIFLAHTTPIVRELVSQLPKNAVITIGSPQGGMVPYTWANEFPGKLKFIDTESLTTNDFSRCPGLDQTSAGLQISFGDWFAHAGKCAPPLPDLVFDISSFSSYPALTRNYHQVYYQDLTMHRSGYRTIVVNAQMFLAVKGGWKP